MDKTLNRVSKSFLILLVSVALVLLGVSSNFMAVNENGCKMPVYLKDVVFDTPTHYTFSDSSKVKFFLLTDIFNIGNFSFSLGDLLILYGIIGVATAQLIMFKVWINQNKKLYKL